MPQRVRFTLIGLGNIGRNLLDVLIRQRERVVAEYGLDFVLVGAADSSGAACAAQGLDPVRIRDLKAAHQGVHAYPGAGGAWSALEMLQHVQADLLVDASPTNLHDGEPGLSCTRYALDAGQHVVAANKGPLVLAYSELMARARRAGRRYLFSGTVAGGLPTVNIGVRDLAGCGVTRVEGIFNGTTNYILMRMEQEQLSFAEALAGAQAAGIAEADPSLDVDGWDAANKLVIVANSVLRRPTELADVQVEGIRGVTLEAMQAAAAHGKIIKLVALAEQRGGEWPHADYALSVRPTPLERNHPLGRIGLWDMGVVYHTDTMGIISAVIEEKGPVPTAAAVLRDMINIYAP